jgi:cytochrome c peroxidase
MYNAGMPEPKPKPGQVGDTLFPKTDKLIRRLDLNKQERDDIAAFLNAITTEPLRIKIPEMPK